MSERPPAPVRLAPTRFAIAELEEGHNMQPWLIWAAPIIATVAAILDAGFMAGMIPSELSGLIATILAAVVGYIAAVTVPKEKAEPEQSQKLEHPKREEQAQQAQKR